MEARMKIWMIVGERMVGCQERIAMVFWKDSFFVVFVYEEDG